MVFLLETLVYVLEIYFFMIIATIILSWIPSLRESRFYMYLFTLTNPYMRIFRGLLVFGGLDFTPIIGIMLYRFGLNAFTQMVASL